MASSLHLTYTMVRLALLLALGCTGSNIAADEQRPAVHRPAPVRPPGLRSIDLPGDARGAAWDAARSTLYLTDDTHASILAWTDAAGFAPVGSLPVSQRVALGGLALLPDGRLVTTSLGFGRDGGVFAVDGAAGAAVPGLDPARRRLAVARAPTGALFVAYFAVAPGSRQTGGVARLDLATGESDAIAGDLGKPVGLAASASTLYVADADHRAIFAYPLPELGARRIVTLGLAAADLLTLLPDGDLVTGGGGTVQRVTAAGEVVAIADGFEQIRGTAYDPAGRRLFVVEHSAASSRHRLHVLPLE